ncbi:MAG: hypothetical protein ABSD76_19010 [Terriglobales bacterium]|jgi:hypothetical protein
MPENFCTATLKILLVSAIALTTPVTLSGQLNSGSIVVVESAGDYVVVAADSLNLSDKGVSLHRCKIIALDSRLVYANTGYTSKASAHGAWDATDIARRKFRGLRNAPRHELIRKLAEAYGAEVAARLEPDILGHPEEGWPQTLTTAIFAGFDEDHRRVLIEVSIHRTPFGVGYSTKSLPTDDAPFTNVLGETTVTQEFVAGRTLRSQDWKNSLDSQVAGLAIRERVVAGARKLVELTAKYQPDLVGGPIDTVVISRSTGVEWVQCKPECATSTRR